MTGMKRFVGIALVVIAVMLAVIWEFVVPESEPEIGAAALMAIMEIGGIGIALSVSASGTSH
jgi:hypothetical protein